MKKKTPQQDYSQSQSSSAYRTQFNVAPIPAHGHTGGDSQQVNYNDLLNKPTPSVVTTYGGIVDGAAASPSLPAGWSVVVSGAHVYTITHNLNNTNYVVVAQPYSTSVVGGFNVNVGSPQGANSFALDWFNSSAARVASDFGFVLTLIS